MQIHEPGATPLPHAGREVALARRRRSRHHQLRGRDHAREGKAAALRDETGMALIPSVVHYGRRGRRHWLATRRPARCLARGAGQRRRIDQAADGSRRRRIIHAPGRRSSLSSWTRRRHGPAAHRRPSPQFGRDLAPTSCKRREGPRRGSTRGAASSAPWSPCPAYFDDAARTATRDAARRGRA